ncbi:hypothetical protein ACQP1O_17430 [Nocardia sp. CA-151230]|uniref:hypothetical protein n=1 Tax=Nocardia sp. CA-151230 TaxID=3239982 RepID=UPI003D8AEFBC
MGSVMQVYLADLATLKAAFGSKDTRLVDAITATWRTDPDGTEDAASGARLSATATVIISQVWSAIGS